VGNLMYPEHRFKTRDCRAVPMNPIIIALNTSHDPLGAIEVEFMCVGSDRL